MNILSARRERDNVAFEKRESAESGEELGEKVVSILAVSR